MQNKENKLIQMKIDCNAPPRDHIPVMVHDPRSLIGILESLDKIEIVGYSSAQGRIPINSNVLDYLLEHPEDIPESWNITEGIIFSGTSYYDEENGELTFKGLCWRNGIKEKGVTRFAAHSILLARQALNDSCRWGFAVL